MSSRVDYCNSPDQLSYIEERENYSSPGFFTRVGFKVLLVVFKALHGISPKYIADLLISDRPTLIFFITDTNYLHVYVTDMQN